MSVIVVPYGPYVDIVVTVGSLLILGICLKPRMITPKRKAIVNEAKTAIRSDKLLTYLIDFFPFPILDDLRWTLVKTKVAKDNDIKVEKEELEKAAQEMVAAQFAQYGMAYIPNEYIEKYAKELLQKEDEVRRIYEHELEDKVVDFLGEQVKLEDNEISVDEFIKLFN